MKKILIVISLLFIFSIIQSCFPTEYYDIVDIEFEALGDDKDGETRIDDALQFVIRYKLDCVRVACNYIPRLVNECYATSRHTAIDNSILYDSFRLSFERPFTFNGQTVSAGTNIFEIQDIQNLIRVYENPPDASSIFYRSIRMDFSDDFLENSNFAGSYIVAFSCKTSDDRSFEKETSIIFE